VPNPARALAAQGSMEESPEQRAGLRAEREKHCFVRVEVTRIVGERIGQRLQARYRSGRPTTVRARDECSSTVAESVSEFVE
jgi:hypothetical protein